MPTWTISTKYQSSTDTVMFAFIGTASSSDEALEKCCKLCGDWIKSAPVSIVNGIDKNDVTKMLFSESLLDILTNTDKEVYLFSNYSMKNS